MITVKEAVQAAINFISELYDPKELTNLTLEEVELSDNGEYWHITLGYTRPVKVVPPRTTATALQNFLNEPLTERVYKIISVRAEDGKATSMKIRMPLAA